MIKIKELVDGEMKEIEVEEKDIKLDIRKINKALAYMETQGWI